MKYTKARYIFLVYLSCCVAFLAASVTQREQRGIGMFFSFWLYGLSGETDTGYY